MPDLDARKLGYVLRSSEAGGCGGAGANVSEGWSPQPLASGVGWREPLTPG